MLWRERKKEMSMSEAVIVAAARSPIGRASKGSLVECRPDDLTVAIEIGTQADD